MRDLKELTDDIISLSEATDLESIVKILESLVSESASIERQACSQIATDFGAKASSYAISSFAESSRWLQNGKATAAEEIAALIKSRGRQSNGDH